MSNNQVIKKKYIIKPGIIVCDNINMDKNFRTSKDSPFKDGYDFFAQRNLISPEMRELNDLALTDPFYPIWHDYKNHEKALETFIKNMPKKGRGRPITSVDFEKIEIFPNEDRIFQQIGKLHNDDVESMYIHTPHALRMWQGQLRKGVKDRTGFTGVIVAIRYMRNIMNLSKADNPYADWALVAIEQRIQRTKLLLNSKQEQVDEIFEKKKKMGINMSKMSVDEPLAIELDFNHPYGHLLVDLLAQYDNLIRSVQSLKIKATITNTEAEKLVGFASHKVRSITEMINMEWRKLDAITQVSRKVLIVDPTNEVIELFKLLTESFGPIPSDILLFKKMSDFCTILPLYNEQNLKVMEQNALSLGLITSENKEYVDTNMED
ncbi:PFL_4669 family integrating conjugative element protein [Neisseria sp. Ec49-e6-T10]|uniref:PFL_4669 family integrating conjugative element protein n=1 Tax=Neisseria sp. Ec49-e6-T10 TaxID=3140744 RepID=UPI003EBA1FB8